MPADHGTDVLPDCEHGYFAAGGTDTCPACDADALDYLERRKAEAARSPQGEDHEAGGPNYPNADSARAHGGPWPNAGRVSSPERDTAESAEHKADG